MSFKEIPVHAIIVHHRGFDLLDLAVKSLLESRDTALEIIVVSNNCQEPFPDVVRDADHVHLVVSNVSLGFSEANNFGVRWARQHLGEAGYYYFVNNDTESTPDALAIMVAALEEDEKAAVAGPQLRILGYRDHLNSLGLQVTEDAWGWDEGIGLHLDEYGELPPRREVLGITGSALLMDAKTFQDVRGWTELYDFYFEDIDLCIKAWEKDRSVLIVPEALVYHQISATMTEDEAGAARKNFFFWRNRLLLAFVHWPRPLLWKLLKWVVPEAYRRPRAEAVLQRNAWHGALKRLPKCLWERFRMRRRYSWQHFLHPKDSVPVITLPGMQPPPPEEISPEENTTDMPQAGIQIPAETWETVRTDGGEALGGQRVLVVGCAPMPGEKARMTYAPGTRTWQMAKPLAEAGHTVCIAALRIPGTYDPEDLEDLDAHAVGSTKRDGIPVFSLPWELGGRPEMLAGLVEAFQPDVLVGASAYPSRLAAALAGENPVWVDLFGDPMAEAQARAGVTGEDDMLAYAELMKPMLERADAFSTVSEAQRYAAIGQLGLYGRLNRQTLGQELVHCLPLAAEGLDEMTHGDQEQAIAGENDFVVLWSGGFNTWCDVETLFKGLEIALAENPSIRFIATGGAIPGHDEKTYENFVAQTQASEHAKRYTLLGMLPTPSADRYLARADLAVVTEKPIYERALGSSGRVVRWLACGLPAVCSATSEIGRTVGEEALGWTYPPGDAEALGRRILEAAADRDELRQRGENGRRYAEKELTYKATAQPLLDWVPNASRVGDVLPAHWVLRSQWEADRSEMEWAKEEAANVSQLLTETTETLHTTRKELGDIHQSRMWSLWMGYFAFRQALTAPLRWLRR